MTTIIKEFIKRKEYHLNKNYIGCIFYGSFIKNTYNENSDIDLIFVFKNNINKKGYTIFKNREIEYFEKGIKNLYKRIDNEIEKRNDSFYSIIGYGKIIEDKNNIISKLQEYAKDKYKKDWDKNIDFEDIKYNIRSLYKSLNDLNELYKSNYFNIYYGIVLEKMRTTYHYLNNLSRIGNSKVLKYYNSKEKLFRLPEEEFILLYKECVDAKTKKQKLNKITKLFNYINKYKINVKDIEIDLKEKDF